MELVQDVISFILHLDAHLATLIAQYGLWTYAILTLIIFLETGIVVTPFLPGDSLLFAAGALSATTALDPVILFGLLTTAAVVGDAVNYWIGARVGTRLFDGRIKYLRQSHLELTHRFYEEYGARTIVIARFVPIVRTVAPFVAGCGAMTYRKFVFYNVAGAVLWVGLLVFGGYLFGNIRIVRDNFALVILAIIIVSLLPAAIEFVRARRRRPAPPQECPPRGQPS
jgi:membrane-associated protein